REARVHVIDERRAKERAGHPREERGFLVGVERIVALAAEPPDETDEEEHVQPDLAARGAGGERAAEMRTARAEHANVQIRRRLAEPVGQDVDLVPSRQKLASAVIGAERRAPRSVEGLRNDLEDVHDVFLSYLPKAEQAARPPVSDAPVTYQGRAARQ